MAVATFPIVIFSVLAATFISEFDLSRWQMGTLITAVAVVAGLMSPIFGRTTDRLGAVKSMFGVLGLGAIAITSISLAPSYWWLVLAGLISGVPNGWANPATNTLIVDNVESGSRGIVTGLKQSGVQLGTFVGGLLLPVLTVAWGWRPAVLTFLAVPAGGLVGMIGRSDVIHEDAKVGSGPSTIPTPVKWTAVYGSLSGLATSAAIGFLPLFAEEDQMWGRTQAGWLIAGLGLVGLVGRIVWPRIAERWLGHGRTLVILAIESSIAAVLLALAAGGVLSDWVLILAALLLGAGVVAWNAVGMLAVMDFSPHHLVGRSTGLVLMGFLLGLAVGAPLMGLSVDLLGSYAPGWFGVAGLLIAAATVGGKVGRTSAPALT
jgi:MFS family permease